MIFHEMCAINLFICVHLLEFKHLISKAMNALKPAFKQVQSVEFNGL